MTKKIFRSIVFMAITTLLASFFVVTGVMYNYFNDSRREQLLHELDFVAHEVENEGVEYFDSIDSQDMRITWVGTDGTVIYDTQGDAESMENHADREEIKEAFSDSAGESSRYSSTLMEKTLYQAKRLSDGSVVRVSVSFATVNALLVMVLKPILFIFALILFISFVLARSVSKKIVEPLNHLDLSKPLENDIYDEIAPMLTYMERQQREIIKQKTELNNRKKEFYTIIKNMNEGLVLLSNNDTILSINPAASSFFMVNEDCVGTAFLEIERNHDIDMAIKEAKKTGHSEVHLSKSGREYQINISNIDADSNANGIVLLVFDISDKVFAERNRKEFTANVTHELKTPLHCIMGSAELLENGLVKPEDRKRFSARIRTESSRLLTLIEDIIRLSQLDEGEGLLEERVDLYELAKEEAAKLADVAAQNNIKITLNGQKTVICGVMQLLHEIIYNLCENAIKYNVQEGSVNVTVGTEGKLSFISVADTGIGIPAEHQDRVFERFYRVDKSHSKETGGTGLGLSIVKHAVQYMHGKIKLVSEVGKGTEIKVYFE